MRPDDRAARAALDACLARLVVREIVQRSPEGARALLAEMREAPKDLADRIDALATEIAKERGAADAHRRDRADADISRIVRLGGFTAIALAVVATLIVAAWMRGSTVGARIVTPLALIRGQLLLMAIALPIVFFARRSVLSTRAARRLTAFMLLWSFHPFITGLVGLIRGDATVDPVSGFVIGGLLCVVGAIALLARTVGCLAALHLFGRTDRPTPDARLHVGADQGTQASMVILRGVWIGLLFGLISAGCASSVGPDGGGANTGVCPAGMMPNGFSCNAGQLETACCPAGAHCDPGGGYCNLGGGACGTGAECLTDAARD